MRVLCLIYNSADMDCTLTLRETDEIVRAHFAFDEDLRREGMMIHADALEPPERATVIRVCGATASATDGPYIETREHLAGFYVIEASDLADATEIAARIPSARVGAIEVRPIRILTFPE